MRWTSTSTYPLIGEKQAGRQPARIPQRPIADQARHAGTRASPARPAGLQAAAIAGEAGKTQRHRAPEPNKRKTKFLEEKVYFFSPNFCESPFFLSELQIRTNHLSQLFKPCVLPPWSGFEGGFIFLFFIYFG
jgi:hypothetical protein